MYEVKTTSDFSFTWKGCSISCPSPCVPFSLNLRLLSPTAELLTELAGHQYELVTFPANPDMRGLGNERTAWDRGIWERHPMAQSGRPGAAGKSWGGGVGGRLPPHCLCVTLRSLGERGSPWPWASWGRVRDGASGPLS